MIKNSLFQFLLSFLLGAICVGIYSFFAGDSVPRQKRQKVGLDPVVIRDVSSAYSNSSSNQLPDEVVEAMRIYEQDKDAWQKSDADRQLEEINEPLRDPVSAPNWKSCRRAVLGMYPSQRKAALTTHCLPLGFMTYEEVRKELNRVSAQQ